MPRNEHPPEYYKSFKGSTFQYNINSRITPQEIKGKNFQKTSKYFFWGKWLQLGLNIEILYIIVKRKCLLFIILNKKNENRTNPHIQ